MVETGEELEMTGVSFLCGNINQAPKVEKAEVE